ncbi:Uu.00g082670.m01.CDS01 [Anthostomella pinea]|uniref:Uu.00g082670.m01.CDS01 n=1 Tax=Anthostomella pinea TaxID=933095 RepID=A0AAI8YJF0_9PEZI|nr:Uu.00g082670.m01.CDS01 [Anthostomella pinea]
MEDVKKGERLIPTPKWFIALRVLQIVIAVVVVGLAGWWIHGLYYDALGFAIFCGLFTWIIALYAILTEHTPACRRAYNTWAILALDGVMVVFWLAALGAVAHLRSTFTVDVQASCSSDGSAVNSGHCTVYNKRNDDDVVGVATDGALAVLSGIAGICAIVMLLFVATFAYVCHYFRLAYVGREGGGSDGGEAEKGAGATELNAGIPPQQQSQPLLHQQNQNGWAGQQQQQQQTGYPVYGQDTAYDPYAPQNTVYSPQHVGHPQQTYSH